MRESGGPYDFVYVHTDIPDGMTIRKWRRQRAAERERQRELDQDRRRTRARARMRAPMVFVFASCKKALAFTGMKEREFAQAPRAAR
jgi:hypothetical protein